MVSIDTPGLLEAIEAKLLTPRPDCKIWPGAVDRGYGRIYVDGSARRVHRVAWELRNEPIPDGMTVDHLCRIRSCVNTEHMELVTAAENLERAEPFRIPSLLDRTPPVETHCRRGHEYTPENTARRSDGTRRCRACRARSRQRANGSG